MSRGVRLTIFLSYAFVAFAVPVLVMLFPGEPPLVVNRELIEVGDGAFLTPKQALGEGAESYELNVLHDLEDRLAGAAAVYPDGGSALVARFASEDAAQAAANKLVSMIPHEVSVSDLWATRFQSDSGEFVVISNIDDLLVFIIADTEGASQERLSALPALIHNPNPGFGAVLAGNDFFGWLLWVVGYCLFQFITLSRLGSWVAKQMPEASTETVAADELRQSLYDLGESGQSYRAIKLSNGDIEITWEVSEEMRQAFKQSGATTLNALRLAPDHDAKVVRAQLQETKFDWQTGVGDELLEGGEATLLGLEWEKKTYIPLMGVEVAFDLDWEDGKLKIDGEHRSLYQSDELYAVVAKVVTSQGWVFRPVISFSKFVSG